MSNASFINFTNIISWRGMSKEELDMASPTHIDVLHEDNVNNVVAKVFLALSCHSRKACTPCGSSLVYYDLAPWAIA